MKHGPGSTSASPIRGFRSLILLFLSALTILVFLWLNGRVTGLVESQALAQSRSYADLIIAARAWNAEAGGVYVRKSDVVKTNPYLLLLGVEPDLRIDDETTLTLRNPSAMTREIGDQLPLSQNGSDFKLTSLDPVNRSNAADQWEHDALQRFDRGEREAWAVTEVGDVRVFRYMRALEVDRSCLTCHADSGYRVGDIRGAISVRLPYEETAQAVSDSSLQLGVAAVAVLAALWAFVWLASRWLQARLAEANRRLEHAANTDALTGLWNRGYGLARLDQELERASRRRKSVGVVLFDIDRFKAVNDTFGHAAGDAALRHVARVLTESVRSYDIVSRIGGEELLVIAPDIERDALTALAERIREAVEATGIEGLEGESITVSAGTAYTPGGVDADTGAMIARADGAMYAAKAAGRNRVIDAD